MQLLVRSCNLNITISGLISFLTVINHLGRGRWVYCLFLLTLKTMARFWLSDGLLDRNNRERQKLLENLLQRGSKVLVLCYSQPPSTGDSCIALHITQNASWPQGCKITSVLSGRHTKSKVRWPARYPSITGDSWLQTSIISTAEMSPLCNGTELRNPNEATANKSPQPPSSRWNPHELIPNHPRQCTGGEYITGSREGTFAEITNFQKIAYCAALQKGAATFMVNGACRRDGLKSKKSLQDRNTAWECTKRKKKKTSFVKRSFFQLFRWWDVSGGVSCLKAQCTGDLLSPPSHSCGNESLTLLLCLSYNGAQDHVCFRSLDWNNVVLQKLVGSVWAPVWRLYSSTTTMQLRSVLGQTRHVFYNPFKYVELHTPKTCLFFS